MVWSPVSTFGDTFRFWPLQVPGLQTQTTSNHQTNGPKQKLSARIRKQNQKAQQHEVSTPPGPSHKGPGTQNLDQHGDSKGNNPLVGVFMSILGPNLGRTKNKVDMCRAWVCFVLGAFLGVGLNRNQRETHHFVFLLGGGRTTDSDSLFCRLKPNKNRL